MPRSVGEESERASDRANSRNAVREHPLRERAAQRYIKHWPQDRHKPAAKRTNSNERRYCEENHIAPLKYNSKSFLNSNFKKYFKIFLFYFKK